MGSTKRCRQLGGRQVSGCSRVSLVCGAHLRSVSAVLKGREETFAASSGFAHPLLPCFTKADLTMTPALGFLGDLVCFKPLRDSKQTSDISVVYAWPLCVAWAAEHGGWVLRRGISRVSVHKIQAEAERFLMTQIRKTQIIIFASIYWIFPVDLMVKNLTAMQETRVQTLDQKDPLEKGMAIHSSILAWRIPWTEEPGRPQSMGSQRVGYDWVTNTTTLLVKQVIRSIPDSRAE